VSTRAPKAAAQQSVEFDWATETARHVGTVVHRELQRIARDGAVGGASEAVTRRRYVDELAELGYRLSDARQRWNASPAH
jgi:hypothetical protein